MQTIDATATTPASRDAVWALLADAPAWARWGSWSPVEVEGGGEQGPGAVRVLVTRPLFRVRERIAGWVPGERLAYEMLDGMRVEGYRSTGSLEEAPGGGTVRDACKRLAEAAAG